MKRHKPPRPSSDRGERKGRFLEPEPVVASDAAPAAPALAGPAAAGPAGPGKAKREKAVASAAPSPIPEVVAAATGSAARKGTEAAIEAAVKSVTSSKPKRAKLPFAAGAPAPGPAAATASAPAALPISTPRPTNGPALPPEGMSLPPPVPMPDVALDAGDAPPEPVALGRQPDPAFVVPEPTPAPSPDGGSALAEINALLLDWSRDAMDAQARLWGALTASPDLARAWQAQAEIAARSARSAAERWSRLAVLATRLLAESAAAFRPSGPRRG